MTVASATGGLVNNTPIICGGVSFTTSTSNICYNLKENDVIATTQMIVNRTYAASIVYNEHFLWITGGTDMALNLIHSSSEFIQTGKNHSVAGSSLPRPLHRHAMVALENDLTMVIGGVSLNGPDNSNVTYLYDHSSQQWTFGPPLITGRYGHAAFLVTDEVTDENMIIVAAGAQDLEVLNSTEILHDDKWIEGKIYFKSIVFLNFFLQIFIIRTQFAYSTDGYHSLNSNIRQRPSNIWGSQQLHLAKKNLHNQLFQWGVLDLATKARNICTKELEHGHTST